MQPTGYIDDVTIYSVSGWAADLDNLQRSITIVVVVNGEEVSRLEPSEFRSGLETVALGATGRYAFKYYFDDPLSPFLDHCVQVGIADHAFLLSPGTVTVSALNPVSVKSPTTPPRPILVTTMGRSGSTLLMSMLATHPAIAVADDRPYEVEMLTYYAYALRAMTVPGDHERSWRPDRITAVENRFGLGPQSLLREQLQPPFQTILSNLGLSFVKKSLRV